MACTSLHGACTGLARNLHATRHDRGKLVGRIACTVVSHLHAKIAVTAVAVTTVAVTAVAVTAVAVAVVAVTR